jgi:hypothetical protein
MFMRQSLVAAGKDGSEHITYRLKLWQLIHLWQASDIHQTNLSLAKYFGEELTDDDKQKASTLSIGKRS